MVVIHDAVRPFVSSDVMERIAVAAYSHGVCGTQAHVYIYSVMGYVALGHTSHGHTSISVYSFKFHGICCVQTHLCTLSWNIC